MKWQGRSIYPGIAQGEALVSRTGISFFGGVDPETGVILERGHDLEGQSIAGKVLIFPTGKGSTVGSYTLYRLAFSGKAPAAVVNQDCETITAVGCIIAGIPCIDKISIQELSPGQYLQVDGKKGIVETVKWPGHINYPLAPPLVGVDPLSFAHYTISQRFPKMVRQVMDGFPWSETIQARLQALHDSLPDGQIGLLQDEGAPDLEDWQRWMRPFQSQTWLEAPWFTVETFFFRQIIAATGYYQTESLLRVDPYAAQKSQAILMVSESLENFYQLSDGNPTLERGSEVLSQGRLADALRLVLWGNQADLSMWSANAKDQPQRPAMNALQTRILVDHSEVASQYILSLAKKSARVDFILDNVGVELAYDLALVDLFLHNNLFGSVVLHVKPHPTYVSDAVKQDVLSQVKLMAGSALPQVMELGRRLSKYFDGGQITIKPHYFWTSPLSGWEMPADLREDLGGSNLIISKGDANYRRWLGDRSWAFITPVESVINYLAAPLLTLRVLKSNVLLGLTAGREQVLDQQDPFWMTNGAWGIIQGVGLPF